MRADRLSALDQRRRTLREYVEGVRDLAIGCLENSKLGCREGKGRKGVTLRVIELSPRPRIGVVYPEHATVEKVEEYEVWGSANMKDP